MFAMRAFFKQRNKELASGQPYSDAAVVEKVFGPAVPAAASERRSFHVAVQGCCHGELDRIYTACAEHERATGRKVDLLICCGDFQSTRDVDDLASMAVPDKYKIVGDFPHYYSPVTVSAEPNEAVRAPYLTLFVGGNHENSDWLAEESYGGFLAPNIYYLGHSGVVEIDGGLRIAGLSGIFKGVDYARPYPAQRPYGGCGEAGKRSAYHVRRIELEKLRCYGRAVELIRAGREAARRNAETASTAAASSPRDASPRSSTVMTASSAPPTPTAPLVDVVVSHDWPAGVTKYGNEEQLLRYKPYFRDEVEHNALGNPYTLSLMRELRPQHWLSAHLHCFFTATVAHTTGSSGSNTCATSFLALDKCAKGHGFLDFLDIPVAAGTAPGDSNATTSSGATGSASLSPPGPQRGPPSTSISCNYRERVRRDLVWLAVLQRAHAHVAANAVAPTAGGFDMERVAAEVAAAFLPAGGDDGGNSSNGLASGSTAAAAAPTTAALLRAMGLPPVSPLQLPLLADARNSRDVNVHPNYDNGCSKGGGGGGNYGRSRGGPPSRDHHGPAVVRDREAVARGGPTPAASAQLEALGWAEDLG